MRTLKPAVRMLEQPRQRTRGTSTQRGYNYRWQRYREAWLALHPLCGDRSTGPSGQHSLCVRESRTTAATDVDHIERISGSGDPQFWNPENHQSLCHSCHSVKTQAEER